MEISKFVQYHGYFSSLSLRLQVVYPNTWILWFTRQLDLELMFSSIICLSTANWNKWTKLSTDLLALSIGSTYPLALFIGFGGFIYWIYLFALFTSFIYSLALFIRFGGFIYWIYLFALFTSFIYSLALFIQFGGFIYWIYLLTLVSAYTVSILIAMPFRFSHNSEGNALHFSHYTYLTFSRKKSSAFHYVITSP